MRTEFGLERTACSCGACITACKTMPAFLIPADLDRLIQGDPYEWGKEHLLASPGAVVMQETTIFRIPTLVPARTAKGSCHWLDSTDYCTVWENAPFGCAFARMCVDTNNDKYLIESGLQVVLNDWNRQGPYSRLWLVLWNAELRAPGPEVGRAKIKEALGVK